MDDTEDDPLLEPSLSINDSTFMMENGSTSNDVKNVFREMFQSKTLIPTEIQNKQNIRTEISIDSNQMNENAFTRESQNLYFSQFPRHDEKSRNKSRSWTPEEDNRLIEAVNKYGSSEWCKIAQYVGNGRTRSQCGQRWNRVLSPQISKDPWTPEEDQKLANLVCLYGDRTWSKIANEMGSRSDVQCRYRWKRTLKAAITKVVTKSK
ncbi:Myb-like DNA-binding domain containing protein [Trichomonas vaginalis G3]|uniref:Myb-like DNA-binding domain containing protein n=1 Tax=Trichomonas vaginalis (strain ATCC PRA-98 / G3) TaxID=412133 RepID=A2FB06_TRIV3|nr:RNA polymerase II transcription regulator recruiting protein [Trichomonas vaginalis G3]EAX97889.1 Myb-like DNA-binding domain containing protein [Trichomonas vaginalis G3]KAI5509840.1 RNA polymerase II transcription regulator recruiting protein [Trichomonas vaginalis G3]|eukprot:XP_001310819.1 Myb-like DNA-binding domain containing protein [Trichomonas vaginalis G3]